MSVCSKTQINFLLAGDLFESLTLIQLRNEMTYLDPMYNYSLSVQGRDHNKYKSNSIEFWIDEGDETSRSGCILADDNKNIHIFVFTDSLGNFY